MKHHAPHTWAVGSTFEYEFDFHVVTNKRYGSAQPDQSTKRPTSSVSRPAEIEPAPKPKRAARKARGTKLTPEERKDRARANLVARRQRRKELGICRDCKNLTVPGKTLCPDCAEKRRRPR